MDVESFVVFLVVVIAALIIWYAFLCGRIVGKRQDALAGINRDEDSSRIPSPPRTQLEDIEEFDEEEVSSTITGQNSNPVFQFEAQTIQEF